MLARPARLLWGYATKLLLVPVIVLMVGAAYTSILIGKRQHELQQVSRYNITWFSNQAVSELARLQQCIAASAIPGSNVDGEEVQLRLDVLANRVGIFRSAIGEIEDLLQADPEFWDTINQLADAIDTAQQLLPELERPGIVGRLLDLFSPFDAGLAKIASRANSRSADLMAEDQQHLGKLHWIFSALVAAMLVCSMAMVALLLWNNRLLHRAHRELRTLADDLRQTGSELAAANCAVGAANEELHRHNELFEAALNNMSQALCMVDGDQRLIVCNRRFLDMFGLPPSLMKQGRRIAEVIRAIGEGNRYPSELIEQIYQEQLRLISNDRLASIFQEHRSGQAIAVSHQPIHGGGWVATYEDITERRRTEARITYMAHHDTLTGLPNRVLFREHLERALQHAQETGDKLVVLCLDLDHFKDVNDTLGHPAGDALLEAAARRLRACVRESDVVARFGGDEFAILRIGSTTVEVMEALARRLVDSINAPYEIDGQRVFVSVSIGIARAPADGDNPDQLLKNADLALYRAKAEGRATFQFFEAEMGAHLRSRRLLEVDLREALPNRQLELVYQPLFNLELRRITGFEALLRWRHPTRGLVSPVDFIPVLERMGLISAVGEWVLRQASADAMHWPDHIKVAVNLSPIQFKAPNLVDMVATTLAQTGFPASRLELEVTESVLLQADDGVLRTLHNLHGLGLRIAMDDFGTGYSSLSYLRQFPFDKIKIDKSFVGEMADRPDCAAIVTSVAMLASNLGMVTVAEGVETERQHELVLAAGCTEGQGYYFDRPRSAAEILERLSTPGVYMRSVEPGVVVPLAAAARARSRERTA